MTGAIREPTRRVRRPTATWKRRARRTAIGVAVVLAIGLLLPARPIIPVAGASAADWNHETFWFDPWGKSGVHKGIDIFATEGTPVRASTAGVVVYDGSLSRGGNVLVVLGPKWRLHYYAHMASSSVSAGTVVARGRELGTVGATGNAAGKPPHLHYSIVTMVPYPWRATGERQGWKKMLYLDPDRALRS